MTDASARDVLARELSMHSLVLARLRAVEAEYEAMKARAREVLDEGQWRLTLGSAADIEDAAQFILGEPQ